MALIIPSLRNQYLFASKLLHNNFQNLLKLKYPLINCSSTQLTIHSKNISKTFSSLTIYPTLSDSIYLKEFSWLKQNYSRWTKYSRSGYFANVYGRKKNKHSKFADLRLKFQASRLGETKRRMKRKIYEIKENVLTIPNGLCALRMFSTPLLAYWVLCEFYTASLGLFILAGFTDLIDGYIARKFPNQQSMIGSFLDPAADKLLIATLFITLTINGLIPVPLTSIIIVRDACLFSAGFYIRYVSLPPPKTLTRYFDMSLITAKLQPTTISKANTLIQLTLVATSLAAPVFGYVDHLCLHALWYITGTTTILSAASYMYYQKSTYKLFSKVDENNNK